MKTFKYRLYPNKTQQSLLENTLLICQRLYNKCLDERITSYKETGKSPSLYDQCRSIRAHPSDNQEKIHTQVAQNTLQRLDTAFQNFFRRVKKGAEKPGYPRFKSTDRYDSFTYPQSGFKLLNEEKRIKLSKIGSVKIKLHRSFTGPIKTCTIKREGNNHWYVCLVVDEPKKQVEHQSSEAIGLDLGCITIVALSNGEKIEHPHYYRQSEQKLKKVQSKYAIKKSAKRKKQLIKLHTKIRNQRADFLHKTSRSIVDRFETIFVEDLNIRRMTTNNYRNLNKSILDGGWSTFIQQLCYKAEEAGGRVIKVNPAYTSQICSQCNTLVNKDLSDRVHSCACGLVIDRDVNAAKNILSFGTKLCNESC